MGLRTRLVARREAYRAAFGALASAEAPRRVRWLARLFAFLVGDAEAFRVTLANTYGERVLADLRRFCRATSPTFDPNNERVSIYLEGRRDVWLRIAAFLNVTDDQVYRLVEPQKEE